MLTDTEIRNQIGSEGIPPPDTMGLFLFVTLTGGKLWRYKYRHGGLQKSWQLGSTRTCHFALAKGNRLPSRISG